MCSRGSAATIRSTAWVGFDRALYTDATGGITVNLAAGTVSGPGVGNDTLIAIEGVVGSDFADTFNAAGFTGRVASPAPRSASTSSKAEAATTPSPVR